jgi:hypothetical protein
VCVRGIHVSVRVHPDETHFFRRIRARIRVRIRVGIRVGIKVGIRVGVKIGCSVTENCADISMTTIFYRNLALRQNPRSSELN